MSGGSQLQNKLGVDVDISYDERSVRLFDVNLRGSIRITASDTGGIDVPSLYDEEASELGAKILSGLREAGGGIESRNLLAGATALQEGYAVATENKEHFQRIPGLTVLSEQELLRKL